jgi:hypothetical protein
VSLKVGLVQELANKRTLPVNSLKQEKSKQLLQLLKLNLRRVYFTRYKVLQNVHIGNFNAHFEEKVSILSGSLVETVQTRRAIIPTPAILLALKLLP